MKPAAAACGVVPVTAARMESRLATPGLSAGSYTTSEPESVTARLNFLTITSGGSSTSTVPWGESADFDILLVGAWRSMTRAPAAGMVASGTTKVSP